MTNIDTKTVLGNPCAYYVLFFPVRLITTEPSFLFIFLLNSAPTL